MVTSVFRTRHGLLSVRFGVLFVTLVGGGVLAKTPDGMPPSQETVCSSLTGAAFGLCNAYCEAQDCDVHPRPSCPVLRRNFAKITGSAVFPCDIGMCGDGVIQPGEDCDPPGSDCPDGRLCNRDCTCRQAFCGDGIVDPGEECDPPGSACSTGAPCGMDCTCATEPVGCCECPSPVPMCQDNVTQSECLARNCVLVTPGTACDQALGRCLAEPRICCQCPAGAPCFDASTIDECSANGCTPVTPAVCDALSGICQPAP